MSKPTPPLGQPPLTPAVFHILLALADGPRHGYAIMQAVEESHRGRRVMRRRFLWSQMAYHFLLGLYPREFRARFASDLEADFGDLLRTRGALATWRRVVPDLLRSVPLTHAGARAARKQARVMAGVKG